jgi:mycothiol synthase
MSVRRVEPESFSWEGGSAAHAVRRVVAGALEADRRSPLNEAAVLTLRRRGLEGGLLLLAGNGDGFAYVHGLSGAGRPELDLAVHPDARGRGLGRELAEAAVEVVEGIPITAWSHGNHPAAATVAERLGFAAVRELWVMRRPDAPLGEERPAPDGVVVRAFEPGRDEDGLLAVNAAAFADHPEQGQLRRAGLDERMAESWFDPAGLVVAEREGRLVAFHWTKVHDSGADEGLGEVYVVGVSPEEQGSGLGRVVLDAGLAHLHRRGVPEVLLYVEADNDAAVALYERRGFTHAPEDTDVMYAPARSS